MLEIITDVFISQDSCQGNSTNLCFVFCLEKHEYSTLFIICDTSGRSVSFSELKVLPATDATKRSLLIAFTCNLEEREDLLLCYSTEV